VLQIVENTFGSSPPHPPLGGAPLLDTGCASLLELAGRAATPPAALEVPGAVSADEPPAEPSVSGMAPSRCAEHASTPPAAAHAATHRNRTAMASVVAPLEPFRLHYVELGRNVAAHQENDQRNSCNEFVPSWPLTLITLLPPGLRSEAGSCSGENTGTDPYGRRRNQ
jgi:hypothetical protein